MRDPAVMGSRLWSGCLGLFVMGAVTLWSCGASLAAPPADGQGIDPALKAAFDKARLAIMEEYCKDLEKEARWALKRKLRSEGRDIIKRIIRVYPEYEKIDELKSAYGSAPKPSADDDLTKDRATLERRLEKVADDQAKSLYELTLKCFKAGLFSDAFHLLNEVLEVAPDPKNSTHKKARRVLGYEWDRKAEEWISEWEADRRKSYYLTDEGWVAKKDRKKWEEGLRLLNEKWVTVEEERAARTRNAFNAYLVETEHFRVETNLGRKAGFEYAGILESFQRAFYRVFISYYDQVAGAKLLFHRAEPVTHRVFVFPSRVDYLNYIKERKGNDELLRRSAGFYSSADRQSRLYWADDDEETYATLFHEVAHQLFAESKVTSPGGSAGNNWVPEGLGTYVETWLLKDGEWYPGKRTRSKRLQEARQILARGDFSLDRFIMIGHEEFHRPETRSANYSLSCALTHFFMHYEDGLHREDFMRFVSAYYAGKVHETSLGESIHVEGVDGPEATLAALNGRFIRYMKKLGSGSTRRSSSSKAKRPRARK